MRTIKVTGNSSLKVKPTLMRVSIEINGNEAEFDAITQRSSDETELIKRIVEKFNFNRKDIKTKNFNIDTKYESYRDQNGDYKSRFVGYTYNHFMYIEFPIDNKLLVDILYSLVKSNLEPKFNVGYTINDSEKEKYKNSLIESSVKNAKERALILAKSAEVNLGEIVSIDYSDKNLDFLADITEYESNKMMLCESVSEDSYNFDIEADDMTISDSVNIIWEIL